MMSSPDVNWEVQKGQAPSVLICHPNRLLAEGLLRIFHNTGFQAFGPVTSKASLRDHVDQVRPDLVLIDWDLDKDIRGTMRQIVGHSPGTKIVLMGDPNANRTVNEAINAGASGCLSASVSAAEFVDALRLLAKGDVVVSRDVAEHLKSRLAKSGQDTPADLSGREKEVLGLVAGGATNREIANLLIVTGNTVKAHLRRIVEKLNLRNRQQSAAFAVRTGVVSVDEPGSPAKS